MDRTPATRPASTTPGADSWRSFAMFMVGVVVMAAACGYLVASEGGRGAMRWVLVAFILLLASLGAGLAVDWRRLDGLTRAVQVLALALGLAMVLAVGVYFPDMLRMMWDA